MKPIIDNKRRKWLVDEMVKVRDSTSSSINELAQQFNVGYLTMKHLMEGTNEITEGTYEKLKQQLEGLHKLKRSEQQVLNESVKVEPPRNLNVQVQFRTIDIPIHLTDEQLDFEMLAILKRIRERRMQSKA